MKLSHGIATAYRSKLFSRIEASNLVQPSSILNPPIHEQMYFENETTVELVDLDTISAAIQAHKTNPAASIAILNFASYKNPGGEFMNDSLAQEEYICYCTNLYNELCRNRNWYQPHYKTLNNGLYTNEAILSKNISIIADKPDSYLAESDVFTIDVVTCAAPNWTPCLRYGNVSISRAENATMSRVIYLMRLLAGYNYDYIVLGAFGCGVFKNNPKIVAESFKFEILEDRKGAFKHIVFAIPDKTSNNYREFAKVFDIKEI